MAEYILSKRGVTKATAEKWARKMLTARMARNPDERTRIRKLQDKLLTLAARRGYGDSVHITDHAGAPTLGQLRSFIYPQWESEIKASIRDMNRNPAARNPQLPVGKKVLVYAKRLRNGKIELYNS